MYTFNVKGGSINLTLPSFVHWNMVDPEAWDDMIVKSTSSDPRQPVMATQDFGSLAR